MFSNLAEEETLGMRMKPEFVRMLHIVVIIVLVTQLTACGYFLYPERRGQRPVGRVDPAIAILDALGLLFFIVPGVIAFVVDITNGTLYLPSGHRSSSSAGNGAITMIRVKPADLNTETIRKIVKEQTGVSIRPDLDKVKIYELDRSEDIEVRLVEVRKSGYQGESNNLKGYPLRRLS